VRRRWKAHDECSSSTTTICGPSCGGVYERAGLEVRLAEDGRRALRTLFEHRADLVVLDLGPPELDGLDVLRRIRELSDVPVQLVTARAREDDKVTGLMTGADDCLTKPFSNRELVARGIALMRRSGPPPDAAARLDDGLVTVDFATREGITEGRRFHLTPTDWNLLVAFVRHPNAVLSPGQLLDLAWHDPLGIGPERVTFEVLRLRRRLGSDDPATSPIEAARGFGYRYRPNRAAPTGPAGSRRAERPSPTAGASS
jgi:DNA-binding response OmpR family regulator